MSEWKPIETAPKDKPILVWHNHDANSYHIENEGLTDYGIWCEGLSHIAEAQVLKAIWQDGFDEYEHETGFTTSYPGWWFIDDGEFEKPINPTHWMPLPESPKD